MAKKIIENNRANHEEIAAYAYQLYLQDGCVPGRDLDHWLRAEAHLEAERQKRAEQPVAEESRPAIASAKTAAALKTSARAKGTKPSASRR